MGLLSGIPAYAEIETLDKVVAIVDDDIVSQSEVSNQMELAINNIRLKNGPMPPQDVLRQKVLDHLILESIQMQMGERAGVRISDAALTQAMTDIASRNKMDLPTFKKMLENEGLSYLETREQIRREMVINRVQQGNLQHRVKITDLEVENFLTSTEGQRLTTAAYHLQHLLMPLPSDSSPEQLKEAEQVMRTLQQQLVNNTLSFSAVSEKKSFQGSALQSSDLGWRKSDEIPSIFAQVTPTLSVGEISSPVHSASGFHLIKLIDKQGGKGQLIKQTHVRHILIKPSEIRSAEQAEEFVSSLRQRIIDGDDFGELAKQYSEDIGSAMQGGDLSWANPGQFVPAFEETMNRLAIDEMSLPFKSPFGWHILQVLERRDQDISELRFKAQAHQMIQQRKFEEELQAWLLKIRDEAFVEYK